MVAVEAHNIKVIIAAFSMVPHENLLQKLKLPSLRLKIWDTQWNSRKHKHEVSRNHVDDDDCGLKRKIDHFIHVWCTSMRIVNVPGENSFHVICFDIQFYEFVQPLQMYKRMKWYKINFSCVGYNSNVTGINSISSEITNCNGHSKIFEHNLWLHFFPMFRLSTAMRHSILGFSYYIFTLKIVDILGTRRFFRCASKQRLCGLFLFSRSPIALHVQRTLHDMSSF